LNVYPIVTPTCYILYGFVAVCRSVRGFAVAAAHTVTFPPTVYLRLFSCRGCRSHCVTRTLHSYCLVTRATVYLVCVYNALCTVAVPLPDCLPYGSAVPICCWTYRSRLVNIYITLPYVPHTFTTPLLPFARLTFHTGSTVVRYPHDIRFTRDCGDLHWVLPFNRLPRLVRLWLVRRAWLGCVTFVLAACAFTLLPYLYPFAYTTPLAARHTRVHDATFTRGCVYGTTPNYPVTTLQHSSHTLRCTYARRAYLVYTTHLSILCPIGYYLATSHLLRFARRLVYFAAWTAPLVDLRCRLTPRTHLPDTPYAALHYAPALLCTCVCNIFPGFTLTFWFPHTRCSYGSYRFTPPAAWFAYSPHCLVACCHAFTAWMPYPVYAVTTLPYAHTLYLRCCHLPCGWLFNEHSVYPTPDCRLRSRTAPVTAVPGCQR